GVPQARIGELSLATRAVEDRGGRAVINAELAFETDLRPRLAGEFEYERMHAELDAFDRPGRQAGGIAQLDAAVDRRVDHDPAGERFVGVLEKLPRLTQSPRDLFVVPLGGEDV